jgi:hypothetical protein
MYFTLILKFPNFPVYSNNSNNAELHYILKKRQTTLNRKHATVHYFCHLVSHRNAEKLKTLQGNSEIYAQHNNSDAFGKTLPLWLAGEFSMPELSGGDFPHSHFRAQMHMQVFA